MSKKIFNLLLISGFFCSCNTLKTINCPLHEKLYESVSIEIPKFKKKQFFFADAESPVDYIFWYKDSASIYISTEPGGSNINYDVIRNQNTLYKKRILADTITLEGQDLKGRYWKDYKINGIYIGYSRIEQKDKSFFDEAIRSFEIIKRKQ